MPDPAYKPLPPGLDPVQAGRFGLWLLGKRSQARAAKRIVSGSRVPGVGAFGKVVTLSTPWTVEEYPGYTRFFSWLCGVERGTIREWLYMPQRLPKKQAARLADWCTERAAAYAALAEEFRAWSERPAKKRHLRRGDRGG